MEEKEYRLLVEKTLREIEAAFEQIDPDEAEFEISHGAATILFGDGTKCILSMQPSVRQVWLANASKGIAVHFNYDASTGRWVDDKGQGFELNSFVKKVVYEATHLQLDL